MLSHTPGGPETLRMTDIAVPEPRTYAVRIAVKAAGVNFPDTIIIRDLYQYRPDRPFAPGGEVGGVVDAIGDCVTGFAVGDRVLGLPLFGGFASHVICDVHMVRKMLDAMPFADAAAFVFTYGASYYALKDRAALGPDDTLLVLGAAGGIGTSAVGLGKAMGAKIIAAVSSPEKAAFCASVGADETIVYPCAMDCDAQKMFGAGIKAKAGRNGVDVIYDPVGGEYAEPALRSIAWEGRYLVVGFPVGIPKIPLNLPLLKNCQIVGVFWGAFTKRHPDRHGQQMDELFALYEEGRIRPRIGAIYPLAEAAKALDLIETRQARGQIVLTLE